MEMETEVGLVNQKWHTSPLTATTAHFPSQIFLQHRLTVLHQRHS